MNNWKVYIHKFPNKKVYIGITDRPVKTRWGVNGCGYNQQPVMWNAIQKYGWDNIEHIILFDNLSQEEASKKEKELIKEYNSQIHNGHGYNIQDGGFGGSIYNRDEVLELWDKGYNAKKIAEIMECNIKTICNILTELNIDETARKKRQQQASGLATKQSCGKKVNQFTLDKKFIQTYDSLGDAARAIGVATCYYIALACKGEMSKANGYLWQYYDESKQEQSWDNTKPIKPLQTKKVIQYDLNMNELNRYDSISDATRAMGKNPSKFSGIGMACNGKHKTSCGFIWKFAED